MIGADIGTQTVAYTSDAEVGLKNLSERGNSIQTSERKERLLHRAMDRSRRATNPQNYNEDGTIKKGRKTWIYSNHYKKLKAKHSELCRINAINRQLAINEDANHLRSLGDVFITEPKNAGKLMRRAKETTVNSKGKFNRKKRFGKSIKNRCPSGFQSAVEQKFKVSGVYILKYLMIIELHSTTTLLMTILKRNYLSECISCKMVLRYKETGIHHSYYTVTITELKI